MLASLCQCGHRADQHRVVGFLFFGVIYGPCEECERGPVYHVDNLTIRRRPCEKFAARKGDV